ncbi:MAG: replication initiator protein A [Lachnospiraceae bacterium]|nr:replication initiator protein A [Lachnospiraceae bacterium]
MGKKLELNYFYGQEADQFNFIRIPKPLLNDPIYKELRLEEVVTYSMLLDRMSLSRKNGWFDELGRAYVYCSIETVMEFANCGKNKAGDILKNLDNIGLIEKVMIPGRTPKIYVKNFIPNNSQEFENQTSEIVVNEKCADCGELVDSLDTAQTAEEPVYNLNTPVYKSNDTRPENKGGVVYFSNPNNNNINNNSVSDNRSNHIISAQDAEDVIGQDEREMRYRALIRENICLDDLMIKYPEDTKLIEGIYDIIAETVLSKRQNIVVASNEYSANLVRSKLLKLDFEDVSYAIESYKSRTKDPKNMRQYMLAVLFNAPTTIEAYHHAEYNRSMDEYYDSKRKMQ